VSMKLVSIYSRCKAADPGRSILAPHENAKCEAADGRFICRGGGVTRTDACTCT
jgi:hypothetical protein